MSFCIQFKEEERGGALPSVLLLIVIVTVMAGILMSGLWIQNRFVQRDIQALQARYTAEGAIFRFLAEDPLPAAESVEVVLPDSSTATVHIAPFGGVIGVTAVSVAGSSRHTARAVAGRHPGPEFAYAVVIGDIHSRLHLAGHANVKGDILTGPLGVRESAFRGQMFSGAFEGHVETVSGSPQPEFDSKMIDLEVERLKGLLQHPPADIAVIPPGTYRAEEFARFSKGETIYISGDLEIRSPERVDLPDSLTILATGDLQLEGVISYRPFSRFAAGETLALNGEIKGKHGLFAGSNINVGGRVNGSGQFLAIAGIRITDRAHLSYPSILYLKGEYDDTGRHGTIELAGESIVDGIPILSRPAEHVLEDRARIVIGKNARLRGALYSGARSEIHGHVTGSVLTWQLYKYHSPVTYLNWLIDHTIDRTERSADFALPIGFPGTHSYKLLDIWQIEAFTDHEEGLDIRSNP